MPEVKYTITGDASGAVAAAQETNAALKTTAQEVTNASQATTDLTTKTGFLTRHKQDLKKVLTELGREFPALGTLGRAALNPIVAATAAATLAFTFAKSRLDEWNKAMDEMEARNSNRDLLPGIEAKREALREAAISAAEFGRSLNDIGREDAFTRMVERAITKLHELQVAQAEVRDAQEGYELARVNAAEKLGQMSPEQAIVARTGIRERYRKEGEAAKTRGENEELALKEVELARARERDEALKQAVVDKTTAASAIAASIAEAKANIEKQKAELEAAAKEADRLEKRGTAQTHKVYKGDTAGGVMVVEEPGPDPADVAKFEKAKQEEQRRRDLVDRYTRTLESGPGELAAAEYERGLATDDARANRARTQAIEREIQTKRDVLPIIQGSRSRSSDIRSATAAMETGVALAGTNNGQALLAAAGTADAVNAGLAVDASQKEQMRHLSSLLRSIPASMSQAVDTMAAVNDSMAKFQAALQQLQAQVKQQGQQAAGMR